MATALSRTPEEPSSLAPAVEHLEQGVNDFLQLGSSSHLAIEPEDVIAVIERVWAGRKAPADPVSPEDFFLESLEEEVIQLRHHTFEKVELEDGRTEMRPLSDETWNACLQRLILRYQSQLK